MGDTIGNIEPPRLPPFSIKPPRSREPSFRYARNAGYSTGNTPLGNTPYGSNNGPSPQTRRASTQAVGHRTLSQPGSAQSFPLQQQSQHRGSAPSCVTVFSPLTPMAPGSHVSHIRSPPEYSTSSSSSAAPSSTQARRQSPRGTRREAPPRSRSRTPKRVRR